MASRGASPTKRTLAYLRKREINAEVVEKRIPRVNVLRDFAGCIDVIAYSVKTGVLGIQATSAANHAARRTKALAEPRLRRWLEAGGQFEIWSWRQSGRFWVVRREKVSHGWLLDGETRLETMPLEGEL